MSNPQLSVVIPAFNEEEALPHTIARISAVADEQLSPDDGIEIIVVSDGSSDDTFAVAVESLGPDLPGRVIEFVRNSGSHAAIRCGLELARGDAVAVISADGQDSPETLPKMLDQLGAGIDVVWGRRANRDADSWLTRFLASAYYRFFRLLTGLDYPAAGLDFLVMNRPVIDATNTFQERNLPLFLAIFNLGFGQAYVDYDRGTRVAGTSGWTMGKKFKVAGDMFIAVSAAPLRLLSLIGAIVGIAGLIFGLTTIIRAMLGQVADPGWASLMTAISIMGGLILVGISILGEYVWRTLDETRRRPLYTIGRHSALGISSAESQPGRPRP